MNFNDWIPIPIPIPIGGEGILPPMEEIAHQLINGIHTIFPFITILIITSFPILTTYLVYRSLKNIFNPPNKNNK